MFSELAEKINQEMDSGDLSLQAIFNRNIEAIEHLKSEGYSYKTIFKKLDTGLHENHFRDLIRRAKKQSSIDRLTINKNDNTLKSPPKQPSSPVVAVSPVEVSEWEKIGINNPRLISNIEKALLTPDEIKSWGCANEMQVSKRVTEYLIKMNKKG